MSCASDLTVISALPSKYCWIHIPKNPEHCWLLSHLYNLYYSQPVGTTTGVESTNFCWVFELRSANLSLKLDPHCFNVRSKRDLQTSGILSKTTGMVLWNDRNGSLRRQHGLKHRICVQHSTNCRVWSWFGDVRNSRIRCRNFDVWRQVVQKQLRAAFNIR